MKIQNKSTLLISILIPLAVGSVSALFGGNMSSYAVLNKPALSPPGFIFPIVWTILYILLEYYLLWNGALPVCFYLVHRVDSYYHDYDMAVLQYQSSGCLFTDSLSDMVYICRVRKFFHIHYELNCEYERDTV